MAILCAVALSCPCCAYPQLHDVLASYTRRVPGKPEPQLEYADAELVHRVADSTGRLEVFTDPRDDAAAADALATLAEMDHHIGVLMGGAPRRFRLFLRTGVDPQQPSKLIVGIGDEPSAFPMPIAGGRLDDGARRHIVRLMTHEWVEQSVLHHYLPFDLYQHDPATRWVGDGIAELVSALVCVRAGVSDAAEAMMRARISELAVAKQQGHDAPRLDGWLRDEGRGAQYLEAPAAGAAALEHARYAACLAVWWSCFEKRQEALLPAFLAAIREVPSERVDSAKCARVLGDITGVDVTTLLASWTVDEAKVVLERAAIAVSR